MQLRPTVARSTVMISLALLIGFGFVVTTLGSFYVSREAIRTSIVTTELPLTAENIYFEIQRDLVQPVEVASSMAHDALLLDWMSQGERNIPLITRYLSRIKQHNGVSTAFLVSEATGNYYNETGLARHVERGDPLAAWYYRLLDSGAPWVLDVDISRLTIFINYRVMGDDGHFLGIAGVGITLEQMFRLIDNYELRYDRNIFFVDADRRIVMTGSNGGPWGINRGTPVADIPFLSEVSRDLPTIKEGTFEYVRADERHYLTIRFIPEPNWYLFVDKHEATAIAPLRRTLWLNFLICLLVTAIVLSLVSLVTRRYLRRIEVLATHDPLTELLNRRGFGLLAGQAVLEARRQHSNLFVLLLDIDHFKAVNDTYGHPGGDFLLRSFAQLLKQRRSSDIVSRWGGEEFVVMLKGSNLQAAQDHAEQLRTRIEMQTFDFNGVPIRITASIGIAQLSAGDSLEALVQRADQALYKAKSEGRNRVIVDSISHEQA